MTEANEIDQLSQNAARHADTGNYAKACNLYERLIARQPYRADTYYRLGEALARRERHEQAIAQYQAALRHGFEPAHNAHYALGKAYRALLRFDEALSEFKNATDMASTFAKAYDAAGQVQEQRGDL